MKRARRPKKVIVAFAAIAALSSISAGAILAAGHGTIIRAGNLVLHAEAATSPKALPKDRLAPISLHASGSVETVDGSHVPPAQTVHLQVGKHFKIDSTGLPSCTAGKIEATSPSQAMRACGPALIGRGFATAQVAFPEQAPFGAKGTLLGFNGPTVGGYPEMLYYTYVNVPAPTALVIVAKLSKDSGPYVYRISAEIPKLAGGSGSFTGFKITIGRQWTYKGQKHSYLNADCPDGRFINQAEVIFGDGTNLSGTLVDSCQSQG